METSVKATPTEWYEEAKAGADLFQAQIVQSCTCIISDYKKKRVNATDTEPNTHWYKGHKRTDAKTTSFVFLA